MWCLESRLGAVVGQPAPFEACDYQVADLREVVEMGQARHGFWDREDEVVKICTGNTEVDELDCFLADQTATSENGCFWTFGKRVPD